MLTKFSLVGLSGVAVNMLFYLGALTAGCGYLAAAFLAFVVAVTNNFIWNALWTFRGRGAQKSTLHKYGSFLVISTVNLAINLLVLHWLIDSAGINQTVAQLLAIAVTSGLNFTLNYLVTFQDPKSGQKRGVLAPYESGYHSNL
jgi:dolichol-phosphate mannosyltransferase